MQRDGDIMDIIEKLGGIYQEYFQQMKQVHDEEKGMRGAMSVFVLGQRDRSQCTAQFNKAVQEALAQVETQDDARRVIDYVLRQGLENRDWIAVSLMLTAVHGYLVPLLDKLTPEERQRLLVWYDKAYPKRNCTPVMRSFRKSLD